VRFAEARAGVFSEVLESDPARTCLILIDTASYARKSILLARKAREIGLPTVIVCDRYSNWPFEFTEEVLVGHTQIGTFWDSLASLTAVLNLLVNSVAAQLGEQALERFRLLAYWGEHFGEFDALTSRSAELRPARR
jgi:DNA-binding MurR/RpiR family transcriptional regulator